MANNSKRNSNRAGAVLITVLTVACFAAILLTAVLTFVKRAHTNAFNNYNSEQAYYIASSALGSVHDYFEQEKTQNYPTLVSYAEAGTEGTITLGNDAISSLIPGGDCKVNISKVNEGYIRLSVTGYYNGQAETINAYYAVTPGQKAPGINNALYSDGGAGFGSAATSSGSVTMRGDYVATNDSTGAGSIITGHDFDVLTAFYWGNDPNGTANSYIVVGHNFNYNNGLLDINPTHPKNNDNVSQFISVAGAFNMRLGATIGRAGQEFDVYCSTANIAATNHVNMYGNLYVYKLDDFAEIHNASCGCTTTEDQNGDLNFTNAGRFELFGDAFVEGDISINGGGECHIIHGTLYISPETTITGPASITTDGASITCDYISGEGLTNDKVREWIQKKYLKINGVSNAATDEELAGKVLTDPINHGSSSSRNSKPVTSFDNYENDYPSTDEFLANPKNLDVYNAYVSAGLTNIESFRRTTGEQPHEKNNTRVPDSEIGVSFDYIIDSGNGCYIDNSDCTIGRSDHYNYVLIDMDKIDGNFVVRLRGSNINLNYTYFIIKNGVRDTNGDFITQPDKFCYFIVEDRSGTDGSFISMSKSTIIDYNTFKYVFKDNRALDISATYDPNTGDLTEANDKTAPSGFKYKLNDTSYVDFGVYTPNAERIYFLLRENDELFTGEDGTTNDDGLPLVMEGIVYGPGNDNGPGAYVHGMGKGMSWEVNKSGNQVKMPLVLKNNSSDEVEVLNKYKDCRLAFIGAVICGSFKDERENFWVSFIPPAPGAGVGDGGSEDVGTVTFSHYESR